MRALVSFSAHHMTQFRPIACTDFERRYNNFK